MIRIFFFWRKVNDFAFTISCSYIYIYIVAAEPRTIDAHNVESLLNSDIRGQQVLHLYKKSKILDYSNLSAVLIDKTLLPDPNVK